MKNAAVRSMSQVRDEALDKVMPQAEEEPTESSARPPRAGSGGEAEMSGDLFKEERGKALAASGIIAGGGGWQYKWNNGSIEIVGAPEGHERAVGLQLSSTDGGMGSAIARELAQITGDNRYVEADSPGFGQGPVEEEAVGPVEPEMTAVNAQSGEDTVDEDDAFTQMLKKATGGKE